MPQTITLTNDGDYIAVRGNHKTNVITFNVLGTFDGASLVGTNSFEIDESNNIIRPVTFRSGDGIQVEITEEGKVSYSAASEDVWYIFTLQNAVGTTSIEIDYTGKSVSQIKTNVV